MKSIGIDDRVSVVPTLSALHALQNHIEGECIYCEEDCHIYSWQENDGWGIVDMQNQGISMNLYELNKSIVNQLPALSNNEIADKIDTIEALYTSNADTHYMLLCKEYNYYTMFECDTMLSMPSFEAAVCEIISNIGEVYSIELTEDKSAIEIWIKPNDEESALAFYLFPYDAGVVYYG